MSQASDSISIELLLLPMAVSLPLTIVWASVYTRIIREGFPQADENLSAEAWLIGTKAASSGDAKTTIITMIRERLQKGTLSEEGAKKTLEVLAERDDEVGRAAEVVSQLGSEGGGW
jgi:hypothetical protein